MHVWHCDITYDVTVLIDDITPENKMMGFGCGTSEMRYHEIAQKWL